MINGSETKGDNEQAQIILFPKMKFTCNFNVTGLTVIGSLRRPPGSPNVTAVEFPNLQIWRQTANKVCPRVLYQNIIEDRRKIVTNTSACSHTTCQWMSATNAMAIGGSDASRPDLLNCTLKFQQLSVNSGDILGLQLPVTNNSTVFEIHFKNSMPLTKIIYFERNSTTNDIYNINIPCNIKSLQDHRQPLIKLLSPQKERSGIYISMHACSSNQHYYSYYNII